MAIDTHPFSSIKRHVFVLGNGQLARMLKQAAEPLGINVYALGMDSNLTRADLETRIDATSVITAEIERWPETDATTFLANQSCFVNHPVFAKLADRFTQKSLIDELGLATATWQILPEMAKWPSLFDTLGDRIVIKTRTGGYDGRGQWRVSAADILTQLPEALTGQAIAESMIPFDGEISIVGARNDQGDKVFYPITHNYHQEGILRASVVFPLGDKIHQSHATESLQLEAERMLGKLLDSLDYVGVMAMECFVVQTENGPSLLINELAPRVHNSGHWTQNGASISQFELHIRAICGLPMPKPCVEMPSIMINIIGTPLDYNWITNPLIHLHWYDKEPRAGRKLGHLNCSSDDPILLINALGDLTAHLPTDYHTAIQWASQLLKDTL